MRNLGLIFGASISLLAAYAQAETVWSNDQWSVNKRDAQNDEDDFKCQLVGETTANSLTIVVSDAGSSSTLEFPNVEGRPSPNREEFPITLSFDDGQPTIMTANFVSEFDASYVGLTDLPKFLEIFSHSQTLEVTGGGIDRTISLKGSRAAANAFMKCVGLSPKSASQFVNSEIYYGSRAGMAATVIEESGLDTPNAIIRIRHTRENAKAFCTEYVLDESDACVTRTMSEVQLSSDTVSGNCQTGEFKDMWNVRYRFEGKNSDPNVMAPFRLRNLQSDTVLDGSSASGYGTAMGVLTAICPERAIAENWN